MENLPSLLESIYTTWLSLSSPMWAMDIILAFVCGLGLYLLLLPFLESHLSSPLPNMKFTRSPQLMTWQSWCRKKFRTHHRKSPKAWGDDLKKLKEKGKDGLFLEDISPGHHLNSLGNMSKSPSTKQDSTTLPPFWNLEEKSEQLMATQELPYPKIFGDHFQQKYKQLFWGLPSLHSESLVAAAWIPQTSSLPSPFFLFNVISSVYPIQMQDKMSPVLSHTHPLSYLDLRSSPLILSPPQFQTPALNQLHLQAPLPALLPPSLPYTRDYGTSCSQSQSKPQCLPTEIQYIERPLLTKQLESSLAFPLMDQRPQEVYDVLAPNLSQDWAVSILPDNFPISFELREKLEQHIQKWLIQHRWDLPRKIQESLEVMQFQNTVTGTCQTRDKHDPSQSFVSMGEHSKDSQKVRFQLEKESGKNLGPILGKISKDPIRYLDKTSAKVQEANVLESERNSVKSLKSNSRNDSTKHKDKNLENTLKAHLGTKSGQINQGLIPLSVRRSWLAMNNGFSMPDIYMETRNLASSKGSEKSMSSSQKLAFLNSDTRQALEAHVVRFWVKHKWGLPLKILKPINLFKLKSVESLPIAVYVPPSTSTSVSETSSSVEIVRVLEKPPQTCFKEVMIEDSSSLGSLLLVSSPSCKDIKRVLGVLPSDVDHEPSKARPTKQESRHHSETLKYNFMDTPSQSGTVLEKERETQEVLLLPRRISVQTPEAHSPQAKVVSESPNNVKTESLGQPQFYTTSVLLPEHSRSMVLPADTLASQVLGDIVVVGGGNSLAQQNPSTPKHQLSQKGQIKVLVPTYQGEDTKNQSKGKHEEGPKFTKVKEKEDKFRSKHYQPPPKPTQLPPESTFQKLVSRFFGWIHPKKTIKGQESPPKKGKPTAATAQSQRRQAKKKPHVDSNVAEAQELITAVGQMLEKKMMLQRKLYASKFNQQRETPPPHAPQSSYGHMPASNSEQKRTSSHPASSSCKKCSIQHRHIRDQPSQKNVRFSNEPQTPQNPSLFSPNTISNLVSSSQNGTVVPSVSSHQFHCPRHCALRRNVYSQL
ncbi:spermatogenesis-associated protein 31 [Phodopus roborovskii]|uniref:Spata31a5 protein n=1 Tax=Phodopus roborovskii TaxID=109678 RepID=A0AAU9ZMJ6_PHORO|nr:spermatogenesis-associated protein 31 [Phodopus roborovskii]CAH6795465.1 Spata31a5 [Phodopus roborovskii]